MDYEGFRKDAIAYAKRRNCNQEQAEDFAQEYCIRAFETETEFIRMDWVFIDYLRKSHGRPGTPGGDARLTGKSRTISLDAAGESSNADSSLGHEYIGVSGVDPIDHIQRKEFQEIIGHFDGRTRDMIELYLENKNLREIGECLGLTDSRVSQLMRQLFEKIELIKIIKAKNLAWVIKNVF